MVIGKNKREIVYKNTYFDIKKIIDNKNEVIIFAIEDSYENILKFVQKTLSKKSKKETEKNNPKNKRTIDLYYTIYTNPKTHFNFIKVFIPIAKFQPFLYSASLKPILKPPII
ncbi:MAG: hypothetical protein HC854_09355 [Flavobacterium sp.]|nr:hypothetical protein [Flavobacterium sp.]